MKGMSMRPGKMKWPVMFCRGIHINVETYLYQASLNGVEKRDRMRNSWVCERRAR